MSVPSLDSCELKLRRAKAHLDALTYETGGFFEINPYEITVKAEPESLRYRFYIDGLVDPPDHWPLIIGDCIHNLRTTLDHLAYQLAILGQGRDLNSKERRTVQFPLFSNPLQFAENGIQYIKLMRTTEQTRLMELQPYNAFQPNHGWAVIRDSNPSPAWVPGVLGEIARLDNIDKHRNVHPIWHAIDWMGTTADRELTPEQLFKSRGTTNEALVNGAEIGYWQYESVLPDLSDVDMKRQFPIGISLSDDPGSNAFSSIYSNFTEFLRVGVNAVAWVLDLFTPCFTHGLPPHPIPAPPRIGP